MSLTPAFNFCSIFLVSVYISAPFIIVGSMHYAGVKETKREFTIHDAAFSAFLWLLNTELYVAKNMYQLKTNYLKSIQKHVKQQGCFRLFQPDLFKIFICLLLEFLCHPYRIFSLWAKNKRARHCTVLDITCSQISVNVTTYCLTSVNAFFPHQYRLVFH